MDKNNEKAWLMVEIVMCFSSVLGGGGSDVSFHSYDWRNTIFLLTFLCISLLSLTKQRLINKLE